MMKEKEIKKTENEVVAEEKGKTPRPFKFLPKAMWAIAERYFKTNLAEGKPFTLSGLALAWHTRWTTIRDYSAKDEYCEVVEKCIHVVQEYWESRLAGTGAAGAMFQLKQLGWRDDTGRPGLVILNQPNILQIDQRSRLKDVLASLYTPVSSPATPSSLPPRVVVDSDDAISFNPDKAENDLG